MHVIDECFADTKDTDTMLIWLSAVGKIQDGKPVILPSEPGETMGLDFLVKQLGNLNAKSVILLLDCNHMFVDQDAYVDDELATDFNMFADALQDALDPKKVTA